jgi:hypothetical protein
VICRLKMRHHLCLFHQTISWLVASSHRLLVMDHVLLHHHHLHHKCLLLDLYHSSLNHTAAPHRTSGKPRLRIVLQQHLRNRQSHLRLQLKPFRQLPKHNSQYRHLLLLGHPGHLKMRLRPLPEKTFLIEHLLCPMPESRLRLSLQLLLDHGLCEQMIERADSLVQQRPSKDAGSRALSSQN